MDIPAGVSFYTGRTAAARRRLEERMMSALLERGFEEVITPIFDRYRGEGGCAAEEVYRFPDQMTGRMLALRHDFTLQIAAMAALRPAGAGDVLRWCYRGNVFRPVREHAGQKRQVYQVGAELLGDASLESTARMVDLAVSLLRAAGLEEFTVVVGHVGILDCLVRALGLPPSAEDDFRDILRRKDLTALLRLAGELRLDPGQSEKVHRSMYLMGGGEVLAEAGGLLGGEGDAVLGELASILELAPEARPHVLFDLTEPRGFDYYTGMMFQVVVPRMGQEVCKGGRYDNLLRKFGREAPAVGFAADLDLVFQAAEGSGREGRREG